MVPLYIWLGQHAQEFTLAEQSSSVVKWFLAARIAGQKAHCQTWRGRCNSSGGRKREELSGSWAGQRAGWEGGVPGWYPRQLTCTYCLPYHCWYTSQIAKEQNTVEAFSRVREQKFTYSKETFSTARGLLRESGFLLPTGDQGEDPHVSKMRQPVFPLKLEASAESTPALAASGDFQQSY